MRQIMHHQMKSPEKETLYDRYIYKNAVQAKQAE